MRACKAGNAGSRDPDAASSRHHFNSLACCSVVAAVFSLASPAWSPAFGQTAPDFWQSCGTAAADAIKAQDFEMAAVMANAALAAGKGRDALGWRPILSRFPLMLAYIEIEKPEELWRPIAQESFKLDISRIDERLKDFIFTARSMGSSFDDHWKRRQGQKEDFKQRARQHGAENLLKIEVALRERLMPEDEDGLADANALLALAIGRRSAGDSLERFSEANRHWKISQRRRGTMEAMDRRFSVAESSPDFVADTDAGMQSTQLFALLSSSRFLVQEAMYSFGRKEFDVFKSKIALASDLLAELDRSISRMRASWSRNPIFGTIARHWGWLYDTEFKMTKVDPGQYPDSFAKAKNAYEEALSIIEYSVGANSDALKATAMDYVGLLREAGQTDDAEKTASRYGIASR
jgi:hypothetical protein